ncbi:DMT family transporter, partial [Rhizobiaceae sp. 2RAB30]
MARPIDYLLASAAGATLAVMIDLNSQLAARSNAVFASWVAHGVGAVVALLLVAVASRVTRGRIGETADLAPAPLWAYLGGIPGAFTVVL